jgi:hypothetical protein
LQAAVLYHTSIELIRILLDAGADVNAVGDDEAVIASLMYGCQLEQADTCGLIHRRGEKHYYDSPLRIAQTKLYEWQGTNRDSQADLVAYLESRRAKSFRKSPSQDTPVSDETGFSECISGDLTTIDDIGESSAGSNLWPGLIPEDSCTGHFDGYYNNESRLY